eukprot:8972432-Pyramimonas_sp.AAC.1
MPAVSACMRSSSHSPTHARKLPWRAIRRSREALLGLWGAPHAASLKRCQERFHASLHACRH